MAEDSYEKPVPVPDALTQPYWDAANEKRLVLQHCETCGKFQFYPRPHCVHCYSMDLSWREASGEGEIYTFSVVHRNTAPGFADELPYVFAIIETKEGVRMLGNVVDASPEDVAVGQPVRVVFVPVVPGIRLPQWTPASPAE